MLEPSGIIASRADAWRVSRYARCFVGVLIRADPRVKRAYAVWQERVAAGEQQAQLDGADLEDLVAREIVAEFLQMRALVAELGLERYKSWLPRALSFEFARRLGIEIDDFIPPADAAWAKVGRRPKNGPKQEASFARDTVWFYRTKVKQPRDTPYEIGVERAAKYGLGSKGAHFKGSRKKKSQYSTVESAVALVERHLTAINAPIPTSEPLI